ncbi:MAG: hypothetical protein ACREQR_00455 [Candidatus Binataceae bacterium]
MNANVNLDSHRGLEAQTGYFVLAFIFSLLFVLVTWRWAGLVNPRVWTVWEQSSNSETEPVATPKLAAPEALNGVAILAPAATPHRKQESKAMLLRMFALGLGTAPTQ